MISFGAVPDEQKYVIYARCSKEIVLISYCFRTILNFAGFRKFLMTASRCHTSFLCVPQGHKSEQNFVKKSSWHMLSDWSVLRSARLCRCIRQSSVGMCSLLLVAHLCLCRMSALDIACLADLWRTQSVLLSMRPRDRDPVLFVLYTLLLSV